MMGASPPFEGGEMVSHGGPLLPEGLHGGVGQGWQPLGAALSPSGIGAQLLDHVLPPIDWPPPAKYVGFDEARYLQNYKNQ